METYSAQYPSTRSAFAAALALSADRQLLAKMTNKEECSLAELIPLTVESVQHFASLVYAVKNPSFNIPRAMMYSKFRLLLHDYVRCSGEGGLAFLDPEVDVDMWVRNKEIDLVSVESLIPFHNLMLITLQTNVKELLLCPLSHETKVTYECEYVTIGITRKIDMCIRRYSIASVCSENDRLLLLRVLAAESRELAPRVVMMAADLSIPMMVIPGLTTRQSIIDTALASQVSVKTFDRCST